MPEPVQTSTRGLPEAMALMFRKKQKATHLVKAGSIQAAGNGLVVAFAYNYLTFRKILSDFPS